MQPQIEALQKDGLLAGPIVRLDSDGQPLRLEVRIGRLEEGEKLSLAQDQQPQDQAQEAPSDTPDDGSATAAATLELGGMTLSLTPVSRETLVQRAEGLRRRIAAGDCPYPDEVGAANDRFLRRLRETPGADTGAIVAA